MARLGRRQGLVLHTYVSEYRVLLFAINWCPFFLLNPLMDSNPSTWHPPLSPAATELLTRERRLHCLSRWKLEVKPQLRLIYILWSQWPGKGRQGNAQGSCWWQYFINNSTATFHQTCYNKSPRSHLIEYHLLVHCMFIAEHYHRVAVWELSTIRAISWFTLSFLN